MFQTQTVGGTSYGACHQLTTPNYDNIFEIYDFVLFDFFLLESIIAAAVVDVVVVDVFVVVVVVDVVAVVVGVGAIIVFSFMERQLGSRSFSKVLGVKFLPKKEKKRKSFKEPFLENLWIGELFEDKFSFSGKRVGLAANVVF